MSTPAGNTSPPVPVMYLACRLTPPSALATLRRGTPVHITQPAAPTCHGVPLGLLGMKPRPLPLHCSTMATVSTPIFFNSPTVNERGRRTPDTSTCQTSGLATTLASGGLRLLRTYSWLSGVIVPPMAARRVSSVFDECTIIAPASLNDA